MSVPGNINTAPPPSSFDNDTEFYEESRVQKFKRRVTEEPLIPLGCALTCWALVEATRSIRKGDKHRTNRMFRRRIYAQGFTILAMLVGSVYWESDRNKRNEFNELLEDKKKQEKHELWLKELEARQEEEDELRRHRDRLIEAKVAEKRARGEDGRESVRSALEECEKRRSGRIFDAAMALWQGRR
ncbi:Respiratory supercomplex factor 1, mitochondrial [Teratosphaeria destructans]|uniref:Respiratory supercomplex factor 1, mitochondrial n=1 Tax=Teratosphaeria destructans TaxID=418781 RepID=A0A9W7SQI1_9PEZI|nr:Respiratory supercomplex factor 1, mitochondrial [Teratosphaeria destructans]